MTRRERARRVMRAEANAIEAVAARLGTSFDEAVEMLLTCEGRAVLTGMGKSGLVARKISATLASTGTPSLFLHPAEAIHGDLGMIVGGDVVLALSQSGETEELLRLLETIRRIGARLIALTGKPESTLAREADLLLSTEISEEGCPLDLAPMASTTAALALGDALAAAVMEARGFGEEDFARLHPGGRLGRKLARVSQLMHEGDALPRIGPDQALARAVVEMSRKRLGCTTVVDDSGRLLGILTDGDLRRLIESGADLRTLSVGEAMTRDPVTIDGQSLASAALAIMEDRKITMIPVVDAVGRLEGLIQVHDLWGTQLF